MELEDFLTKMQLRPLPGNPMARVRLMAKELAEGATEGTWGAYISAFRGEINEPAVNRYLEARWNNDYPNLELLVSNAYLEWGQNALHIGKAAFDLLEITEPASIFISYRREDSSAFALLILARLKAAGLDAFLDVALQPGDNWRQHIKDEIQRRDHLILLLGRQTLSSEVVCQEVEWALEANKNVMPIWHNKYAYKTGEFDRASELDEILKNTHTIRVLEESALGYNNALVELLNRFGVTPD